MRKLLLLLLLVVCFVPAVSAQAHDQGTSEEYAYFTYQEKSDNTTFMVDAFQAFFSEDQPYVPLHVAVARFKGKPLQITLESFRLTDAGGNSVTPASLAEIQQKYERLRQDKQLMMQRPLNVGSQFATLTAVSAAFYPETSGRLATSGAELPGGTWWQGTVYFPMPKGGLEGVLSMELRAEALAAPMTVKFEIPLKHHKHGSDGK